MTTPLPQHDWPPPPAGMPPLTDDLARLRRWTTAQREFGPRHLPEWWPAAGAVAGASARPNAGRNGLRLPTPPLQVLGHPWVQFALWQPEDVHRRLGRLALWRRPAVWRMAIARPDRQRLLALAPPPDLARTCLTGVVPSQALAFEWLDWAGVGLRDWAGLLPRGAISVLRCVRWTLPRERVGQACRIVRGCATIAAPDPALLMQEPT